MDLSTERLTIWVLFLFQYLSGLNSTSFTIVNNCSFTIWPAGVGTSALSATGFALQPGESHTITAPLAWSGRFWGRTLCSKESTGKFSCITGDCGSSTVECAGGNPSPPVTLAEFTLNGAGGLDFFDVSLVDGYNLPMTVEPQGGTGAGNCIAAGCEGDLTGACPMAFKVMSGGTGVGCKSACEAFGEPQYCCTGPYKTPETCPPTRYSQFFKSMCPLSVSYAFDATSTFSCGSADYSVVFCAKYSPSSMEPVKGRDPMAGDNSRGQAFTKIVAVVIGVVISICGLLACKLRFFFSNRNCRIEFVSEVSNPSPQPVSSIALTNLNL